jgi:hypothetical protein
MNLEQSNNAKKTYVRRQFLDFLRFHLFELLIGLAILGIGIHGVATYIPLPDDLPFSSPFPFEKIYWSAILVGPFIVCRAIYKWNKLRVR